MRFDLSVPANGYVWWYLDALSDDGQHGITLIAFIGSVFSPYYAWARRRGAVDPEQHCALNVALYGPGKRWAMTERRQPALRRTAGDWVLGPSALHWDGAVLTAQIDERSVPLPRRLRGQLRLYPAALSEQVFALDTAGRHRWQPLAPAARVEVELQQPALRWSGTAYLDTNAGDEPLEQAFYGWHWARAGLRQGAALLYEADCRDGSRSVLALRCDPAGRIDPVEPPPPLTLPRTRWQLARATRAERGQATVLKTLEDTPFYARSLLSTCLLGERVTAMHESLSLERFRQPWVQMLLPFRMPRRGR